MTTNTRGHPYHCKCGRPIGRFDPQCSACLAADIFGMRSAPTHVYVLCDCFENSDPDPNCPRCQGFGEIEVACPF